MGELLAGINVLEIADHKLTYACLLKNLIMCDGVHMVPPQCPTTIVFNPKVVRLTRTPAISIKFITVWRCF